jgi:hypothetical protein
MTARTLGPPTQGAAPVGGGGESRRLVAATTRSVSHTPRPEPQNRPAGSARCRNAATPPAGPTSRPGGRHDRTPHHHRRDGITKLLRSRCVDCNGPTVGDTQAIRDGFYLFLTRHATTCPMWGERAHRHGVSRDNILVHPLGHLDGDENMLGFLGDVGDGGRRG